MHSLNSEHDIRVALHLDDYIPEELPPSVFNAIPLTHYITLEGVNYPSTSFYLALTAASPATLSALSRYSRAISVIDLASPEPRSADWLLPTLIIYFLPNSLSLSDEEGDTP